MCFWREVEKDSPAAAEALPALNDEMVAACEKKFGVKFPRRLLELLRTKNGGSLDNPDFKFQGRDCQVSEISGIHDAEKPSGIMPCSSFLNTPDLQDWRNQLQQQAGDPSKLLIFGEDHPYSYVLDYNHLNSVGGPKILCVLMDEDIVQAWPAVDSFEEFLKGQYFGDPEPTARFEEAQRYRVISEGGYEGKHSVGGSPVRFSWKISSRRTHVIVFAIEDWGRGEEYIDFTRSDFHKSSICFRRHCINREKAVQEPDCYSLWLEVQPAGKGMVHKTSKPYKGRWKNTSSRIVCTKIYSANKSVLEQALNAVVESCSGLKRFTG